VAALRPWTPHESAFLAWTRLRVALGQALGLPDPRLLRPKDMPAAPERPAALHECSPVCARRVAAVLVHQGLAVPDSADKAWLLPAASATAIEACWNLVPGFHGRWPTLWDLASLESCFGGRPFASAAAASWLARCDAEAAASPQHRRRRGATPAPAAEERVRTLVAQGWLAESPGGLHLARSAQDALMLLRIVTGARVQLPPGGLDGIGRIRIPHPPAAAAGAAKGGTAGARTDPRPGSRGGSRVTTGGRAGVR
jgi:hypothetical protein